MRKGLQFLLIANKFVKSIYTSKKNVVCNRPYFCRKTPLKHAWRHILDIFAEKKTPFVCQKANFCQFC